MAVIRQQTQFVNKPIGVVRTDTGEDEIWKSVAEGARLLSEISYKNLREDARDAGIDAGMAVDRAEITTFDPETQKPVALTAPRGMGRIARQAREEVIERRFISSVQFEIEEKSREISLKYPNPNQYTEMMARYVGQMKQNAGPQYQNIIDESGRELISRTEFSLAVAAQKAAQAQLESSAKLQTFKALREVEINSNIKQEEFDVLFNDFKEKADTQLKVTGNQIQYIENLDKARLVAAGRIATKLSIQTKNMPKSVTVAIEAAILDPTLIGLVTDPALRAQVDKLYRASGGVNLDKLASKFSGNVDLIDENQQLIADEYVKNKSGHFDTWAAGANKLSTLPEQTDYVLNYLQNSTEVKNAPSQAKQEYTNQVLNVLVDVLNRNISQQDFSDADVERIQLAITTKNLDQLNAIGSPALKESLTKIIKSDIPLKDRDLIAKGIKETLTTTRNVNISEEEARRQLIENEARQASELAQATIAGQEKAAGIEFAELKGKLEVAVATGESGKIEMALQELVDLGVKYGPRLSQEDQEFIASNASSAGAKARLSEGRKHFDDNINKQLLAAEQAASDDDYTYSSVLEILKTAEANIEKSTATPAQKNTWRSRVETIKSNASQGITDRRFRDEEFTLRGAINDLEAAAPTGEMDIEYFNTVKNALLNLTEDYPNKIGAATFQDLSNKLKSAYSTNASSSIFTKLSEGTMDTGFSPQIIRKIELAVSSNDTSDLSGAAKEVADSFLKIKGTAGFSSEFSKIQTAFIQQANKMFTEYQEEQQKQNSVENVILNGSQASKEDVDVYEEFLGEKLGLEKGQAINYADPNIYYADAERTQPSDFFKNLINVAGKGVLTKGFAHFFNYAATTGNLNEEQADLLFSLHQALTNSEHKTASGIGLGTDVNILEVDGQYNISSEAMANLNGAMMEYRLGAASPQAALREIISNKGDISPAAMEVHKKRIFGDRTLKQWASSNFPNATPKALSDLMAIANLQAPNMASEEQLMNYINNYIDEFYTKDDRMSGETIGDKYYGGVSSVLPKATDRSNMETFTTNEIYNILTEFEKLSLTEEKSGNPWLDLSWFGAGKARQLTENGRELQFNWKYEAHPTQKGLYYVTAPINGLQKRLTYPMQVELGEVANERLQDRITQTIEVPLTINAYEHLSETPRNSNLINFYHGRYMSAAQNDPNGGRVKAFSPIFKSFRDNPLLTAQPENDASFLSFAGSIFMDFPEETLTTMKFNDALMYARMPELLQEAEHMENFKKLVEQGVIEEDTVDMFLENVPNG